jgi:hypothetical protein
MGNQWIEHVKRFAKHHGISYTEALKHAGPSYRNLKIGGGLEDLEPELKGEVSPFLDNRGIGNLAATSRAMRNVRDFESEDDRQLRTNVEDIRRFLDGPYKSFKDRETARKRARRHPENYDEFFKTVQDYFQHLQGHQFNPNMSPRQVDNIERALVWLEKMWRNPV